MADFRRALNTDDPTTWPKAERMAYIACVCDGKEKPEHWQAAKEKQMLCARCAFMIRPPE